MQVIPGSHALVTGGSSGIGFAIALRLGQKGAKVTIWARGEDRLAAAAAALRADGADVRHDSVDVADPVAVAAAHDRAVAHHGPVDILVTSAGVSHPGRFLELDDQVFRDMMEIDYFGTLHPIRAVAPGMAERGHGSIVGISSAAALLGIYGYTAYGAAKFAVRGLLEALRGELKPHGVHVACVYPPDVDTPMLTAENEYKPAETAAISAAVAPISPDTVALGVVRAIEKGSFAIYSGIQLRALAALGPVINPFVERVFDRTVRTMHRQRPGRPGRGKLEV